MPAAATDEHRFAVDGFAEDRADERPFGRSQPSFAARRTGDVQCFAIPLWSVPVTDSTFSGSDSLSPPAKTSVISVVLPALTD